ncbi:DUF917 family protein [Cupriavidus sp. CuC1]|uniref:S-methyl thiohydantoin desulfurase domain-containing protein n=1 Tax=Cupriavidus sp. CuC1 TaxID=3373131 RepID=UPI0037CDDC0D
MTELTLSDIEPGIVGGMLLSAGGSGRSRVEKDRNYGALACQNGPIPLISTTALQGKDQVMIASGVGAPGGGKLLVHPGHSIAAAKELVRAVGRKPDAVMPGHVPGLYAWLVASELSIPMLDAATNGRGHPTVKMGSLGLSSRPDSLFYQAGSGDNVRLCVHGNTLITSALMRAAAVQNGGLIMAARGYFDAALVEEAGAVGAITYQIGLGRSVMDAGASASARLAAAVAFTKGQVLAVGPVLANTVAYRDGFDIGQLTVRCEQSKKDIVFGVCNEFMTAEHEGTRIATFPDLIASLDAVSGDVIAISEAKVGTEVAIFAASKRALPMGSGLFDPTIYPDVERLLGQELAAFALDRTV